MLKMQQEELWEIKIKIENIESLETQVVIERKL